jgi:KaiC/GvpD/RAD55 family RecA-like ATPase
MIPTLHATVLKALLKRDNWNSLEHVVDQSMFDETNSQEMYKIIKRLHGEVEEDITITAVRLDVEASYPRHPEVRNELLVALQGIEDAPEESPETLRRTIKRFTGRSYSMDAGLYVAAHVEDDDFDPSIPLAILQKAVDSQHYEDMGMIDYASAPPPSSDDRMGVVPLCLGDHMNNGLGGGSAIGELVVYTADTNTGKTVFLAAEAVLSAQMGSNVLFVSLEMHMNQCRRLLDQILCHMTEDELISDPVRALRARKELKGSIQILDWSGREATVADIRGAVMATRQQGINIDTVCVDYLSLMVGDPGTRYQQKRMEYEAVSKNFRRLSHELGFRSLTAWQAKRPGDKPKHVLEKNDVAEDYNIARAADIMISLNQNPEERKDKIIRVNTIKQRRPDRPRDDIYFDPNRMKICRLGGE